MLGKLLKRMQFNLSRVGKRVDRLWDNDSNPTFACALDVRHSISWVKEEVDLVVSGGEVRIQYRQYEGFRTILEETNQVCLPAPNDVEAQLRSMGILELPSVSESLFDGSQATIAARDSTHRNIFREYSISTPQARLRDLLVELGYPATDDDAPTAQETDKSE